MDLSAEKDKSRKIASSLNRDDLQFLARWLPYSYHKRHQEYTIPISIKITFYQQEKYGPILLALKPLLDQHWQMDLQSLEQ